MFSGYIVKFQIKFLNFHISVTSKVLHFPMPKQFPTSLNKIDLAGRL